MMGQTTISSISKSGIFFSCAEKSYIVKEHVVPEHVLTHVFSGRLLVTEASRVYTIEEGDTVLFRKNHLAKITKFPNDATTFKSISIFFTTAFLQKYFATHPKITDGNQDSVRQLNKHPLLDSLFNSLSPYFDFQDSLPEELAEMKLMEAMTILRKIDTKAEAILADFAEPGKIDLSGFMQQNYSFNIPMERFAYLSGRSLATFKRDFQKIFNLPPQRWLLQKRLERAHYLIAERKRKPSDVYLEVGFENLSHFSFAFKQAYGYNPSGLAEPSTKVSLSF
ncbi:helix-turn-helix domain-containing protein [Emticicia fontis]